MRKCVKFRFMLGRCFVLFHLVSRFVSGLHVRFVSFRFVSPGFPHRVALARSVDEGAESILLDLRHNPGGFFPGGIDVAR